MGDGTISSIKYKNWKENFYCFLLDNIMNHAQLSRTSNMKISFRYPRKKVIHKYLTKYKLECWCDFTNIA